MTQQLLNKERQTPLTLPTLPNLCMQFCQKFFFDFSTYFWAVIAAENNRRIPTLAPLIKTPKVNGRNDFRTRYVLKWNSHKTSTVQNVWHQTFLHRSTNSTVPLFRFYSSPPLPELAQSLADIAKKSYHCYSSCWVQALNWKGYLPNLLETI